MELKVVSSFLTMDSLLTNMNKCILNRPYLSRILMRVHDTTYAGIVGHILFFVNLRSIKVRWWVKIFSRAIRDIILVWFSGRGSINVIEIWGVVIVSWIILHQIHGALYVIALYFLHRRNI